MEVTPDNIPDIVAWPRSRIMVCVALLLLVASALRFYVHLQGPPTVSSERQFRSAIIARSLYFKMSEGVPEWRIHVNSISRTRADKLEPPVLEAIAAVGYRILGREAPWVPRFLSSVFWLIGGMALFGIASRLVSPFSGLVTMAYYLTVPFGAVASVAFLPDPLMLMVLLLTVLAIVKYHQEPRVGFLLACSVLGGLAILIKPFCLFTVLGAFYGLTVYSVVSAHHRIRLDFVAFTLLALLIGAPRYIHGAFFGGGMSSNFQVGFLPYLYFTKAYWVKWLLAAIATTGAAPFVLSLLGLAVLRRSSAIALAAGMVAGYLMFGLAYTYFISISRHYHLQLLPVVGLLIGPLGEAVASRFLSGSNSLWRWGATSVALILVGWLTLRDVQKTVQSFNPVESEEMAAEIGELVHHSTRTVYLASYYGAPLEYLAELSGTYWPRPTTNMSWFKDRRGGAVEESREDSFFTRTWRWLARRPVESHLSIEERFDALDFQPEYFIITGVAEMGRFHPDLKRYLDDNWTRLSRSEEYFVYQRP